MSINFSKNQILDRVINLIQNQSYNIFGSKKIPGINCDFIIQRPYSLTAKLNVTLKQGKKSLYVKIPLEFTDQSQKKVQEEYHTLSYFYDKLYGEPKFSVVKPIVYFKNPSCLITEMAQGRVLHDIIRQKAHFFSSKIDTSLLTAYCRACGEWLKNFQGIEVPHKNQEYQILNAVDFIHDQISRCSAANLLRREIVKMLQQYVNSKTELSLNSDITITGMHSDFVPVNIIVNKNTITVLDFNDFKPGPVYRDVASFLYAIDSYRRNPLFSKATLSILKKAFLDGYEWNGRQQNPAFFSLCQVREVLGGLLQQSQRTKNTLIGQLKLIRLKRFSEKQLLSAMSDYSL